jgi:hypothetical protein
MKSLGPFVLKRHLQRSSHKLLKKKILQKEQLNEKLQKGQIKIFY